MGCYAMAACKRHGMEVVLATNDKDLYQLVGSCVKVYTTAKADLASPKDAFALLGEDSGHCQMGSSTEAYWRCPGVDRRFGGQHSRNRTGPQNGGGIDSRIWRARAVARQCRES